MKNKLKKFWGWCKPALISYLKKLSIKKALKFFLGTTVGVGFKARVIKYVVAELFEDIAEPIIKAIFTNTEYTYHRIEGKILIKRLNKAIEDENEDDYNSTVDDILS